MKRNLQIITCLSIVLLACNPGPITAQTNEQMVGMVKNMLQQFEETKAENEESDEVINEGVSFNSDFLFNESDGYTKALKEPGNMFSLTDYQNGYSILDEKEYPTNSINLIFSFVSIPGFMSLNAWYDIESIEDTKGKNLLLSAKNLEKYMEYGLIDDEFNYNVPGEFSLRQWLARELEHDEKLKIKGSIGLEYPADYISIDFTKEDVGKTKSIGNTEITLLDIDRNMITLVTNGNRNEIEGLQMVILNSGGKVFPSTSSIGMDVDMYDVENKSVKSFTEDEIAASVENFDFSSMEAEQVKKIKVFGNIYRVVFLKIKSHEYLDVPFNLSLPFEY